MKISRIDTFILKAPLGEERFWSSQCCFEVRKSLLVRLEADSGLVGWGEAGQYGPAEPAEAAVHSVFAPILLGQDPCQPEVLWERMYAPTRDFGRQGATLEALSALDIASWDIFGKAQGLPVHALMGGAFREKVRTYATGLYYRGAEPLSFGKDLPRLREEAVCYAEQGFPAIKMKIGLLAPPQDLERIAAVREAVGKDVLLMVDANHAYQSHVACWMAQAMEQHEVFWFEEPVVPEDLEGYRRVKASTRIAIAGGECEYTRFGFSKWISSRALDIVQPDLCCAGGLSEVRRIAALASAFAVQCIPHVWGSGVALAAGLQLLAQLPPTPHTHNPLAPFNEPMLEWDGNPNPLRTMLLTEPICPVQGEVEVPNAPGLGVEINEGVLSHYLTAHHTSARKPTLCSSSRRD
jgi:D-galactarolactone cycloisomerase